MLPPPIRGVVVAGVVAAGVVVAGVVVAAGVLLNIADAVATADAVADVAGGDSMVVVVVTAAASSFLVVLGGVLVSASPISATTEVVSKPPSTGAMRDLASVHSRRLASTGTGRCPNIHANSSD